MNNISFLGPQAVSTEPRRWRRTPDALVSGISLSVFTARASLQSVALAVLAFAWWASSS